MFYIHYMAGIMSPKTIRELRDARVYQMYDVDKIQLRVTNGDGAAWTKGTTAKGGIYQKDNFHIHQEITRDVPKEYRNIIEKLVEKKDYSKIAEAIESALHSAYDQQRLRGEWFNLNEADVAAIIETLK